MMMKRRLPNRDAIQPLPLDGPGYEAIRISRNRYWGQPVTLDFIKRFSEQVRGAGQAPLYIGDIGQPRGGPDPIFQLRFPGVCVLAEGAAGDRKSEPGFEAKEPQKPADVAAEWTASGERLVLAGNGLRKYGAVFAGTLGERATVADEALWAPSSAGLFAAWRAARDAGDEDERAQRAEERRGICPPGAQCHGALQTDQRTEKV